MRKVTLCRRCGVDSEHYIDGSKAAGVSSYCVECTKAARKDRYHSDPAVRSAAAVASARWVAGNPEKVAAAKVKNRLKNYGVTICDFTKQRIEQMDRCAICDTEVGALSRIDHDHSTGRVRGILCHNCNVALGHMFDDVNRMTNAIDYLEAGGVWRT